MATIGELTGKKVNYRRMSTYNYYIRKITVTKDGSVKCSDGSDIIERIAEMGFTAEPERIVLTVEIPNTLNKVEMDRLKCLIVGNATLIQKAVSAESLDITVVNNNIVFPWFTITDDSESDETAAYTAFKDMLKRLRQQYPVGYCVELLQMDDVATQPTGTVKVLIQQARFLWIGTTVLS